MGDVKEREAEGEASFLRTLGGEGPLLSVVREHLIFASLDHSNSLSLCNFLLSNPSLSFTLLLE